MLHLCVRFNKTVNIDMARYQQENKEKAILETAEKVFMEKGLKGARTQEIAEAAGVTHAMLHYYFSTKEQLFEKVLNSKLQLFAETIAAILSIDTSDPKAFIMQAVEDHFAFIRKNPTLPRFVVNVLHDQPYTLLNILREHEDLEVNVKTKMTEIVEKAPVRMDPLTLLMDIIMLDFGAFLTAPLGQMLAKNESMEAYIEAKKLEIITLLLMRIGL